MGLCPGSSDDVIVCGSGAVPFAAPEPRGGTPAADLKGIGPTGDWTQRGPCAGRARPPAPLMADIAATGRQGLAALRFDTSRFQITAEKVQVRLGLRLVSTGQEWSQPVGPIGLPRRLMTFGTRRHVRGGPVLALPLPWPGRSEAERQPIMLGYAFLRREAMASVLSRSSSGTLPKFVPPAGSVPAMWK